ncbi:MAG: ElyC/SanA/YdcF family protein [Eubacteriales bacterium]
MGQRQPSGILKDRINTGVALYESGASDRLLMSGDHGQEDYDEVNAMKDYAIESGVAPEVIFMDHAGSPPMRAFTVHGYLPDQTVVIVSQTYHLYRALYIARALGLDAYGVSADRRDYNTYWLFDAREILARCKDFLTDRSAAADLSRRRDPITGNGSETNG